MQETLWRLIRCYCMKYRNKESIKSAKCGRNYSAQIDQVYDITIHSLNNLRWGILSQLTIWSTITVSSIWKTRKSSPICNRQEQTTVVTDLKVPRFEVSSFSKIGQPFSAYQNHLVTLNIPVKKHRSVQKQNELSLEIYAFW